MAIFDYRSKIVYFTNFNYGTDEFGISVPIFTIKVSNTRSKILRKRTPGKSPQISDTNPKDTKISDRLKISNIYEIDGYITPIGPNDTDGSIFPDEKTAKEVKEDLIKYMFNENTREAGRMFMTYEGKAYDGTIEKLDITEESTDFDPSAFPDSGSIDTDDEKESSYLSGVPKYSIKLIFVAIDNSIT